MTSDMEFASCVLKAVSPASVREVWFWFCGNTTIRLECQSSWYFILFGVPSLFLYACFDGLDGVNDHSPQIFIPSYKKKVNNNMKLPVKGTGTFEPLARRRDFLYL